MLWRVVGEVGRDKLTIVSAGVAFYGLLALFPALIGTVLLYGLFFDPADVARQDRQVAVALPNTARSLITTELNDIVRASRTDLGVGLAISLGVSLFGASTGMKALMAGIGIAYDEEDTRGWLRMRLVALALSLGLAFFVICAIGTITLLPHALGFLGLAASTRGLIGFLRWPALCLSGTLGLLVLYRYAPNRNPARWPWLLPGAVLATAIWLTASLLLSVYVESYGRFNATYGTLGGVVVLLLWMYVSAFAILLGAELNAELEHQTEVDTTVGPPAPMGERGATVADALGESFTNGATAETTGLFAAIAAIRRELMRPRRGKSFTER